MVEGRWTAIGLTRDFEPGGVAGVIVEEREWALWRAESGAAHLWEDRCPHRGMRMSFGFVRGDRLACLYHGWQYDEDGRCRYIPAHRELDPPATICIAAHPLVESAGILWACFDAKTPEAPSWPEAAPVRSLYVDAPLADALRAACVSGAKVSEAPGVAQAKMLERDGDALLVAGQIVTPTRSALHVALIATSAEDRRARQKHHAQWAETIRRALEARR
jgi:nitrite reductase/ring-hydroxylating ferredoxin subunit